MDLNGQRGKGILGSFYKNTHLVPGRRLGSLGASEPGGGGLDQPIPGSVITALLGIVDDDPEDDIIALD